MKLDKLPTSLQNKHLNKENTLPSTTNMSIANTMVYLTQYILLEHALEGATISSWMMFNKCATAFLLLSICKRSITSTNYDEMLIMKA